MDTFGDRLRSEREDRGLSIQAVAEIVGVEGRQLQALERNEFMTLPDEATMMKCLQSYAECLQVEADLMIEDYVQEREKVLRQLAETVTHRTVEITPAEVEYEEDRRPLTSRLIAMAVVLALVGVVGAWWILSGDDAASSGSATEAGSPAVATNADATAPQASNDSSSRTAPAVTQPTSSQNRTKSRPTSAASATLSVPDHGVGTAVQDRELVGRSDRFTAGTQVWFWTRVEGGSRGDKIEHVWLHDGAETARIPLRIGGSRWRTYSSKTLRAGADGVWAVEARDEAGRVLARREFDCVP